MGLSQYSVEWKFPPFPPKLYKGRHCIMSILQIISKFCSSHCIPDIRKKLRRFQYHTFVWVLGITRHCPICFPKMKPAPSSSSLHLSLSITSWEKDFPRPGLKCGRKYGRVSKSTDNSGGMNSRLEVGISFGEKWCYIEFDIEISNSEVELLTMSWKYRKSRLYSISSKSSFIRWVKHLTTKDKVLKRTNNIMMIFLKRPIWKTIDFGN